MDYYERYNRRLNKLGENKQQRVQSKREREFKHYVDASVYKIEFIYENRLFYATLEKYKQDTSRTLQYLLTPIFLKIPEGTILTLPFGKEKTPTDFLVFYLEDIGASGYNKYIVMKVDCDFMWIHDENEYRGVGHFSGPGIRLIDDLIKSRNRMSVYEENDNNTLIIMPSNHNIKLDDYLVLNKNGFEEHYRVVGLDTQSTDGILYVTINPVYEYDLTPPPQETDDDEDDFFWIEH